MQNIFVFVVNFNDPHAANIFFKQNQVSLGLVLVVAQCDILPCFCNLKKIHRRGQGEPAVRAAPSNQHRKSAYNPEP